jgi:hypothetical protein
MKYKKENPDSATSTTAVAEDANKQDNVNAENVNKIAESNETELSQNKSAVKSESNNSGVYDGTLGDTKGPVASTSTQNFKAVLNSSGVYDGGESNLTEDNSGIYGIDLIGQSSVKRGEKKKSIDASHVAKNELKVDSNKKKTPSESAKSSRRSSTQSRHKANDAREDSEKEKLLATKRIDELNELVEPISSQPSRTQLKAKSNEKNNEAKQHEIDLLNETIKSSNLKDGHIANNNELNSKSVDMSVTSSPPGFLTSTPRKPAFNPLHVILKDKNKYHTTEYI